MGALLALLILTCLTMSREWVEFTELYPQFICQICKLQIPMASSLLNNVIDVDQYQDHEDAQPRIITIMSLAKDWRAPIQISGMVPAVLLLFKSQDIQGRGPIGNHSQLTSIGLAKSIVRNFGRQ